MSPYSGHDHYFDSESGVLKNLLGIRDAAKLEQAEAALVATRSYELSRTPLKGHFDLAHLQAIHRYLFGDVYEWAGQLHDIDVSKSGHLFAHHAHIASAAATIFRQLTVEKHLVGLDDAAFSHRAAYYLGELNALHSFREGNGRTQLEFISHLAQATGCYVAWEDMKQPDLLLASMESFKGDTSKLAELIRASLR